MACGERRIASKFTGKLLDERLGRWQLFFIRFNVTFFPMHILGLAGMPRRVYTYAHAHNLALTRIGLLLMMSLAGLALVALRNCMYWHFVALAWLPIYALLYRVPRPLT